MKLIVLLLIVVLATAEASTLRNRVREAPAAKDAPTAEAVAEPADKKEEAAPAEAHKAHWTYVSGEEHGPETWFKLPGNEKCELSVVGEQSPINLLSYPPTEVDLATADDKLKQELSWKQIGTWVSSKPTLKNNGHTLQVDVNLGDGGNVEYAGENYVLKQFHFHAPSEHAVGTVHRDGHYMMEMHMVHLTTSEPPKVLVIGSFLEKTEGGEDTEFFEGFYDSFPKEGEPDAEGTKEIDAGKILTKLAGKYYSYKGSFTTPPCTEGVRWIIFQKTLKVAESIRQKFLDGMPDAIKNRVGNARPLQPLNLRNVYLVKPDKAAAAAGAAAAAAPAEDQANATKEAANDA